MLGITLERQSEIPLKRQLYQSLKSLIMDGRLKGGEALPSTRELAKYMGLSRNTVCEAYEMLIAEGFVVNRQGSPTRVAQGVYVGRSPEPAKRINEISRRHFDADFRTGLPDLDHFPRFAWKRILHKAVEEMPLCHLGYTGPQGLAGLRAEIAAWLFRSRGLRLEDQDIFITAGATQALHLIADLLSRGGRQILIEDPCHTGMKRTFTNKGFTIIPVPVDGQGMRTGLLDRGQACAVYVTPSHQFPLGGILPAGRRAALIRFARENGIYIVEDDYDSEFRYAGEPVAPLYAMDPQRVIYVGTFSKVLFPALRVGYVVLPRLLQKRWCYLRTHVDVQNPPYEQAALAEFMRTRKLDRHIQKMRRLYGERRLVLLQALRDTFGRAWRPWGDAAGLHLAVEFPGLRFDGGFMENCRKMGIRVIPVENHCIRKGLHADKLLLGYGHLETEEIRKGILLLKKLIR